MEDWGVVHGKQNSKDFIEVKDGEDNVTTVPLSRVVGIQPNDRAKNVYISLINDDTVYHITWQQLAELKDRIIKG